MPKPNHYQTLGIPTDATQQEIKQAYRQLAKQFHPDCNNDRASHEKFVSINAAYEVLSDPASSASYDRAFEDKRAQRNAKTQTTHHRQRESQRNDDHTSHWLKNVYQPVIEQVDNIINPLQDQIDHLAADPFDDDLLAIFQQYLERCEGLLEKAKLALASQPNPTHLAGTAASLYHCLSQLEDGIEELGYFPLNFDEQHLHMGQELFRIATSLQQEAEATVNYNRF